MYVCTLLCTSLPRYLVPCRGRGAGADLRLLLHVQTAMLALRGALGQASSSSGRSGEGAAAQDPTFILAFTSAPITPATAQVGTYLPVWGACSRLLPLGLLHTCASGPQGPPRAVCLPAAHIKVDGIPNGVWSNLCHY